MKFLLKYWYAVIALLCCSQMGTAQITDMKLDLRYDTSKCEYGVYMRITGGSMRNTIGDHANSGAQISLVAPIADTVYSITSYEPRHGYGLPSSWVTPVTWSVSTKLYNHSGKPGYSLYSITPDITGGSWFDTLNLNDEILLFTIKMGLQKCGDSVRLWRNNEIMGSPVSGGDPTSNNLSGGDFNNSLTLGQNGDEIYAGNLNSILKLPKPKIVSLTPTCTSTEFKLKASVNKGNSCGYITSLNWTGPSSFSQSGLKDSIVISSPTAANTGSYKLVVIDTNGCTDTFGKGYNAISCLIVFPIKLTSFMGVAENCMANLVWTTTSVANFKEYEVQYSRDGKNYETVGKVAAEPNKDNRYSFQNPQASGKGYYRLKVMDLGGKDTYSETIVVVTNCPESAIKIFPNPATSVVHVQGVAAGDEVKIMDALGQVVTSAVAPGNITTLDLTPYAPGVYSVMVTHGAAMTKAGTVVKQ